MPRNKQTTEELLKWAKGKCYIEVVVNGQAKVHMSRDDFETRYWDRTLRRAILRAQREEAKR